MTRARTLRLVAVTASALALNGCGEALQNDGHMFQRMADQIGAIPIDDTAHSGVKRQSPTAAAASADTRAGDSASPGFAPMVVHVVDALDMPESRDAGLRTMLQVVDQVGARAAGLRSMISAGHPGLPAIATSANSTPEFGQVRLAAFPSESAARQAWVRLKSKSPALLSAVAPRFERTDLGARGVWVRLTAGPVRSSAEAEKLCAAAGAASQWCAAGLRAPLT